MRLLAESRHNGDPQLARQAADWFADRIRREREKVHATGMVNLHDWHEIATGLEAALSRPGASVDWRRGLQVRPRHRGDRPSS